MRQPGWEGRLTEAFNAAENLPFFWSKNDCVTFSASVVKAMTGVDLYESWYEYRNEEEALAIIGDLKTYPDNYFARVPPSFAQRGDLVWFPDNTNAFGGSLGAVAPGGARAASPGCDRLAYVPVLSCEHAWRVE
jgi:hypothetical protein